MERDQFQQHVIDKLDSINWFEGFDDEAKEDIINDLSLQIKRLWDDKLFLKKYEDSPIELLCTVNGDLECVADEDSIADLLETFADSSYGLFQPDEVDVSYRRNVITVSFEVDGVQYTNDLDNLGEEVDLENLLLLINSALDEHAVPMKFIVVNSPFSDYGFQCLLASKDAIKRAVDAGLFPEIE